MTLPPSCPSALPSCPSALPSSLQVHGILSYVELYLERLLPQGLLTGTSPIPPTQAPTAEGERQSGAKGGGPVPAAGEADVLTLPGAVEANLDHGGGGGGGSSSRPGSSSGGGSTKRASTPLELRRREREAARGMGAVRLQARLFGLLDALVTSRDTRVLQAVAGRSRLPSLILRVARMFRKVLLQSRLGGGLEALCGELHRQEVLLHHVPFVPHPVIIGIRLDSAPSRCYSTTSSTRSVRIRPG